MLGCHSNHLVYTDGIVLICPSVMFKIRKQFGEQCDITKLNVPVLLTNVIKVGCEVDAVVSAGATYITKIYHHQSNSSLKIYMKSFN